VTLPFILKLDLKITKTERKKKQKSANALVRRIFFYCSFYRVPPL